MSKNFRIYGFLAFVMTIVVFAIISVNVAFQEKGLSDLSLANLETLAQGENGNGYYYVNPCGKHPGTECSTRTSPYTCSSLTYC